MPSPSRLRLWLRISPYYAYHATVVAVFVGWAAAHAAGFETLWPEFLLTLAGALAVHTAGAFSNEYFDFVQRADAHVDHRNPYAGGSRVLFLQEGLPPRVLLVASFAFAGVGSLIGLYLALVRGLPLLFIGLAGYGVMFFYTAPPGRLAYRGLGELGVGLSFGPFVVLGSYYVQTQRFDASPVAASVLVGLFIALVLLFNEFPDYEGDRRANKRTQIVRWGPRRAVALCAVVLGTAYVLLGLFVLLRVVPTTALFALVTLPLSIPAFAILYRRYEDPDGLRPANATMLVNHLVLGMALTLAFLAA